MDILELTKKIISFKSTSYNELELANFISGILSENNIDHILDEYSPSKYAKTSQILNNTANVYIEAGCGPKTLILYSHIDVVDGRPELFEPETKDGRLYGRGTVDMKSALAGLLFVLINDYKFLKNSPNRIIFAFISDEETSATGIKRFVEWLKDRNCQNLWCVLMEPTEDFTLVQKGGKGYAFLNLEGKMKDVVTTIKKIYYARSKILSAYPDLNDGFGPPTLEITKIHTKKTIEKPALITAQGKTAHASQPLNGINAVEIAINKCPELGFIITHENDGPNSIPSSAYYYCGSGLYGNAQTTAFVDMRTNLYASKDYALFKEVLSLVHPDIKITIRDKGHAFLIKDPQIVDICTQNQGFDIKETIAVGGSDAPYLLELTDNVIPGFGPGENKFMHTADESIDLDVLFKTPEVIRQIIRNFSGN